MQDHVFEALRVTRSLHPNVSASSKKVYIFSFFEYENTNKGNTSQKKSTPVFQNGKRNLSLSQRPNPKIQETPEEVKKIASILLFGLEPSASLVRTVSYTVNAINA